MRTTGTLRLTPAALAMLAVLTACQSLPSNSPMLEKARADYRAAEEDPHVRELAKSELRRASDAMNEADRAWARNEDADEIEHMAYMAKQRVAIAQETAVGKRAELMAAPSASKPTRDPQLEVHLERPSAKASDRGSVIVIRGLLFDTRRTQLNADGLRNLDKLARILNRHPQRTAMVEGFTDNAGGEAMNEVLSCRRADAVRAALLERGVAAERVGARGYGEAFPITNNDTAAGRRLNRRVEIVLSDDTGKLRAR